MVHKHWGHLLPDVAQTRQLQIVIIDDVSPGQRVRTQLPEVVKIEDDEDDDEVEELSFLAAPKTEQEIEERMSYLLLLSHLKA